MFFLIFGCKSSNVQLEITDYLNVLENDGMSIGEKNPKLFHMIQAVDGYGVEINGDTIEIYKFDTTITSGRDAIEKWKHDGIMGRPVVVRKNLMLFVDKKHEDWNFILENFNSL